MGDSEVGVYIMNIVPLKIDSSVVKKFSGLLRSSFLFSLHLSFNFSYSSKHHLAVNLI